MSFIKRLYSRNFLFVNLVILGIVVGFVLAFAGFSGLVTRGAGPSGPLPATIRAESPVAGAPPEVKAAIAQAESVQNAFRYVASTVLPAVVEIDVREKVETGGGRTDAFPFDFFFGPRGDREGERSEPREERGLGSGVIVRRTGRTVYVLTNDHVVGKATSIRIKLQDEREFDASLVGTDERKDIALVKFETDDRDIAVAILGDSSALQVGDWAIAVGSPFGLFSSVTTGIVSAVGRSGGPEGNISDFIQTDAAINRGNSGGALVNIHGEVIGINTWIASPSGGSVGLGFAIPINNVKSAVEDFITHGKIKYGWLGVSLLPQDADRESARELGIEGKRGAFVSQLFLKGPADTSGILPGDLITAVEGRPVRSQDTFIRMIGDIQAGTTVKFTVDRGGTVLQIPVKIEERDRGIASNDGNLYPGLDVLSLKSERLRGRSIAAPPSGGVFVANVAAKSPAANIGVKPQDIVVAVNERKVGNLAEFYAALNDPEAKKLSFTVLRDGQEIATLAYVKK